MPCTPSGCATIRPYRSATCIPGPTCGIVLGRRPVGGLHGRLRRRDHVHFRATGPSDDETPGGHEYPSDLVARWNANLLSLGRPKFRRERHDISGVSFRGPMRVNGERTGSAAHSSNVTMTLRVMANSSSASSMDERPTVRQRYARTHVVLNWFAELKRVVPTEEPTFAQEPAQRPIGNEQSLAFIGSASAREARTSRTTNLNGSCRSGFCYRLFLR